MTYANLSGTTIRHAAVRGVRLDGIAARRNTERLLEQIPDAVPGMGASAVLCVRQMSVHVRCRQRYVQSGSSFLGEEMEHMARHAARPALGAVPPDAAAVLFADRAELLTCLARDYVRNLLVQGWWWRVLLPEADIVAAALRLWVNEAAHAPAALARLAHTGDAHAFVRALGDAEVSAVLQALVRSHGLALLAEDVAVDSIKQSRSRSESSAFSELPHDNELGSLHIVEREVRAALPEAWSPGLTVMRRHLLAVGLSLVRLPGLVRNSTYAQVLSALLVQAAIRDTFLAKGEHAVDRKAPAQSFPLSSSLPPAGERAIIPSPVNERGLGRGLPESGILNKLDTSLRRCGESLEVPNNVETSLPPAVAAAPEVQSPTASTPNLPTQQPLLRDDQSAAASVKKRVDSVAGFLDSRLCGNDGSATAELVIAPCPPIQPASFLDAGTRVVDTKYGGVFFLCNAALVLGLYPDFTRPLDRGLELSLWDFLALAAVDLGGPAVRQDPLWPLLAEFAGRASGQRPGAGFAPPGEWRLPEKWLMPFAGNTEKWTWEADAARLVVRHPAGFVVLDLLRTNMTVEEQLRVELAQYAVPGINQTQRRRAPVTSLARWRGWLMTYLGRRVARALGDKRWRLACRQMLCLPARLECDAERLDVYFSLEQLPIAVRMAGLDRDPGWIPAAGRDVRLHFGCAHD